MSNTGTIRGPTPKGLLRMFLRFPILLYRVRLGWILGHRFLLLTHVGRNTGIPRQTVLEVVKYESATQRCVIASGWGEKAQWFKNIIANPNVVVTIGAHSHQAKARRLNLEEAEHELRSYAHRHPWSMKQLTKSILGTPFHAQDADFQQLAAHVPLVELRFSDVIS